MTKLVPCAGYFFRSPTVLPVIYYHDIVDDADGFSLMRTGITNYKMQMGYLHKSGYKTLLFSELPKDMK